MFIPVRLRRGRLVHLITEGSDSPVETLCGRASNASIVSDRDVDCPNCFHVRAKRIAASR